MIGKLILRYTESEYGRSTLETADFINDINVYLNSDKDIIVVLKEYEETTSKLYITIVVAHSVLLRARSRKKEGDDEAKVCM